VIDVPTVLITGGGTGLGKELALLYAKNQYNVVITGRDGIKLAAAKEELLHVTKSVHTIEMDVKNAASIKQAISEVISITPIDVLVNNAGVGYFGPFIDLSEHDINEMIDTNVKGTIFMCQELIPHLLTRPEATILNIISTAGLRGKVNESVYVASKFAVRGFTESLQKEYEGSTLHISGAYMGGMATPFWDETDHIKDPSRLKDPAIVAEEIYNRQKELEIVIES